MTIVIIAECRGGRPSPVTYELMSLAEKIRRASPMPVKTVVLGDEVEKASQEIAEATGVSKFLIILKISPLLL